MLKAANYRLIFCMIALVWFGLPWQSAQAQLRIVSYNTATGAGSGSQARTGSSTVLEAIGAKELNGFAKPIDVLLLQEQGSVTVSTQSFVNILNDLYDPIERQMYARGNLVGGSLGAGRPAIVYNTQSVELVQEAVTGTIGSTTQARQTLVYQMRPVGYDSSADFFLYNSHYKAGSSGSDEDRREVEAANIRLTADTFPEGTPIIYAGDFNIRGSGGLFFETDNTYPTLAAPGNGQAFDPIEQPGFWSSSGTFTSIHTQAPSQSGPGSLVGGGVDDRFDFQLVTNEWLDGEGLSYLGPSTTSFDDLEHSYHAFGNNGSHGCCNNSISDGNAESPAVLAALETASDHLPVVADYQLPALMSATLASALPESIELNDPVMLDVLVENAANVIAVIGADELDYSLSVTGDLFGSATGVDFALEGGNIHQVTLDTSSLGTKSGIIRVESTSEAVANGLIEIPVDFNVVQPAIDGDFDGDLDVDGADFLAWQRGLPNEFNTEDLVDWRENFGEGNSSLSSQTAVPEPSTMVLFAVALLANSVVMSRSLAT